MFNTRRRAKVNIRFVIVLVTAVIAAGFSLFAAREAHRAVISKRSLEEGQAAYEQKDWAKAAEDFRKYMRYNPNDLDILKKYAEALMSIRPMDAASVSSAIRAYRRIVQMDSLDQNAYEKLAQLYGAVENFEELAYIARTRLKQSPSDSKAHLWLAQAQAGMLRFAEARETLDNLIEALNELPQKPDEYVQACSLMSKIVSDPTISGTMDDALDWLTDAVEACPQSVEALATRAQFYRQRSDISGLSEEDRLAKARGDLDAADALGTGNPRIRLFLGSEWLELGEPERANAELKAIEGLPQQALDKYFIDPAQLTIGKFLLSSKLAMKKKDAVECAALAEKVLMEFKVRNYRSRVLPAAVMLYIAAGETTKAKQYLDEYLDPTYAQEKSEKARLESLYLQALVARIQERPYDVINILQPAVTMDASRAELWQLMAEAYIQTDQPRRAVKALIKYLNVRPRDKDITLQLANEYLKLQDWTKAFETARLAESMDETDILIRLMRIEASIYQATERSYKANALVLEQLQGELEQLREEHPDRTDIRILQSIVADGLGHTDEAESLLRSAIKECPDTLRAQMQLVNHYYRSRRIDEAVNTCRQACDDHNDAAEPWLTLSNLHVAANDYQSAESVLAEGIEKVAGKLELWSLTIQRALVELLYIDRSRGIQLLGEVAGKDPQEIRARRLLLNIREVQEDETWSQTLIKELREAEGETGLYWRLYQAALWLSADDWRSRQTDITNAIQQCINADPEWPDPSLLQAAMYQKMGDLANMEQVCRRALSRNPAATNVADVLISLLEQQGRFSDAETVLAQVETNSRVTSAWNVRIAVNSGDFTRAIDELRLRVSNDDQDANSRILLARLLYWQNRDAKEAFSLLDEVEAMSPNLIALCAARVAILRAEERFEEAEQTLDAYVNQNNTFSAYAMRANYLANTSQPEAAEKDYKKLTTFTQNGAQGYQQLSSFYAGRRKLDPAIKALEEGLTAYPEDLALKRSLLKALLTRNRPEDQRNALDMLEALQKKLPNDPELMKLEAMHMLRNPRPGNVEQARQQLERVVQLEPTAVDAHLMLISIAMQQERYQDARDRAILALGSNPNNTMFISARARAELELENIQTALELAWQALEPDPRNAEAINVIIRSNNRNLLEKAQSLIESAFTANPEDTDLLLSLSRIYIALGQPETAIKRLEAYSQTETGRNSIPTLVMLAHLYRVTGAMEMAEQKIEQAAQINPKNLSVVHCRLLLLMAQKKYDDLSHISAAYLSADEQNTSTLIDAASALRSVDSETLRREAVTLLEEAVKITPASKTVQIALAATLYQTGEIQRALSMYRQLLEQYPNDIQILIRLASIEQSSNQNEEAIVLLERAVKIDPELKNTQIALATTLYQTGEAERAVSMYKELLEQYPNDVQILNNLAWILQEHDQRYDEALELVNRGLALSQNDIYLLDTRGNILANMNNRLADARDDYERLVELTPANSPPRVSALLGLGRVYAKLKELDQAQHYLQDALEINRQIEVLTQEEISEIQNILDSSAANRTNP